MLVAAKQVLMGLADMGKGQLAVLVFNLNVSGPFITEQAHPEPTETKT